MSSQSRGVMRATPVAMSLTLIQSDYVIVSATPCQHATECVDLGLDTSDQQTTIFMTWAQLESIHHQLGIALRQKYAQTLHVDPVEGCPFCPEVQLPEGESWGFWDDCDHYRKTGEIRYVIRSNRTHVVYADGLSYGEAIHLLETLTDPIPTVEIE